MKKLLVIISTLSIFNVFSQQAGRFDIENDDGDSWIFFHDPGQYWYSMGLDHSKSGNFSLNVGPNLNSSQFVMTTNAKFGFGTDSPVGKLDINPGGWGNIPKISFNQTGDHPSIRLYRPTGSSTNPETTYPWWIENKKDLVFKSGGIAEPGSESVSTILSITRDGELGLGTETPKALLDVSTFINDEKLGTVFGRLTEGNSSGEGTYLGVRGYGTQSADYQGKSFAIEHGFYGNTNSSINFYRGGSVTGGFITINTSNNTEKVRINSNGNVGIGVTNPTQKLQVAGTVYSMEVKVEVAAGQGPDYVFEPDYELRTLEETKEYIEENKHLPEIPSAKEMEADGIDLGDMNMRLLKKIEELTLYQIDLLEKVEKLQQKVEELEKN